MTPLHVAAETGGRSRIINYLVDRGANINIQDIHSQVSDTIIQSTANFNLALRKSREGAVHLFFHF